MRRLQTLRRLFRSCHQNSLQCTASSLAFSDLIFTVLYNAACRRLCHGIFSDMQYFVNVAFFWLSEEGVLLGCRISVAWSHWLLSAGVSSVAISMLACLVPAPRSLYFVCVTLLFSFHCAEHLLCVHFSYQDLSSFCSSDVLCFIVSA